MSYYTDHTVEIWNKDGGTQWVGADGALYDHPVLVKITETRDALERWVFDKVSTHLGSEFAVKVTPAWAAETKVPGQVTAYDLIGLYVQAEADGGFYSPSQVPFAAPASPTAKVVPFAFA